MKKIFSIIILFTYLLINNAAFAINRNNISVVQTQQILKSRLKKEFIGYKYTITNNSKTKINIINAQIINGIDGANGYNTVESGGGKAVGVLWLVCGPVGVFTLGIGWLVGVIGTPIAWFVGDYKDKKARRESIAYTNIIPLGELSPKESVEVMTLIPIGTKPQLKLSIYNNKEYQNFVY